MEETERESYNDTDRLLTRHNSNRKRKGNGKGVFGDEDIQKFW
jgi:hypothetical protein